MSMKRYKIFYDENNVPTLVEFPDCGNVVLYDEAMAEIERLNDELLCCSEAFEALNIENARLADALETIANPIEAMREQVEVDGVKLNEFMAVTLSLDPDYLQGIARTALNQGKG